MILGAELMLEALDAIRRSTGAKDAVLVMQMEPAAIESLRLVGSAGCVPEFAHEAAALAYVNAPSTVDPV